MNPIAQRIARDFSYHPPKPERIAHYTRIREEAKALAITIAELCPAGREQALALTNLEQAVMWANAAIAREVPNA